MLVLRADLQAADDDLHLQVSFSNVATGSGHGLFVVPSAGSLVSVEDGDGYSCMGVVSDVDHRMLDVVLAPETWRFEIFDVPYEFEGEPVRTAELLA